MKIFIFYLVKTFIFWVSNISRIVHVNIISLLTLRKYSDKINYTCKYSNPKYSEESIRKRPIAQKNLKKREKRSL